MGEVIQLPNQIPNVLAPPAMSDFAWHATARLRYCYAYCTPRALFHTPGCAYHYGRWIKNAIEEIRRANRGY